MLVFLSWSGERSRTVAKALGDWLPMILQPIRPWFSDSDIEKGATWYSEISKQLAESRFAIICLTPENLDTAWINYEAGALSRSTGSPLVVPFLFGFKPSDLRGPLAMFQAAQANQEDTLKLVLTMNRALGDQGISEERLRKLFDILWPTLGTQLSNIAAPPPKEPAAPPAPIVESSKAFDSLTTRIGRLEETIRALVTSKTTPEPVPAAEGWTIFLVHGANEESGSQ